MMCVLHYSVLILDELAMMQQRMLDIQKMLASQISSEAMASPAKATPQHEPNATDSFKNRDVPKPAGLKSK